MDKNVDMSTGAGAGFVQQSRSMGFEARDRGTEIRDLEGDMMQAFAALLDEFRDHRIGARGFQQLNARTARGQHDDVDLFLLHGFAWACRESKLLLIEGERGVERSDGDAEVVNVEIVWSRHRLLCTDPSAAPLLPRPQPENQYSQIVRSGVREASRADAGSSWRQRGPWRRRGPETIVSRPVFRRFPGFRWRPCAPTAEPICLAVLTSFAAPGFRAPGD